MGRNLVSLWQHSHRVEVDNRQRERPMNPPSDYEFTGAKGLGSSGSRVKRRVKSGSDPGTRL